MHQHKKMSSFLSCRSTIVLITVRLSSLWISLSTFTAAPQCPRKAVSRQVHHRGLHVPT